MARQQEQCDSSPGQSPRPSRMARSNSVSREIDGSSSDVSRRTANLRVGELEAPEPRHEPVRRERRQASRARARCRRCARRPRMPRAASRKPPYRRREPPARRGESDVPRLADEERLSQPVLQRLDLVADRGLGHAELLRGAGEAPVTGGRLEGANGARGRTAWAWSIHKPALWQARCVFALSSSGSGAILGLVTATGFGRRADQGDDDEDHRRPRAPARPDLADVGVGAEKPGFRPRRVPPTPLMPDRSQRISSGTSAWNSRGRGSAPSTRGRSGCKRKAFWRTPPAPTPARRSPGSPRRRGRTPRAQG